LSHRRVGDPPRDVTAELRHLRAFVAVADELSFSRAAERLHMSQQALSRTIRQLEARSALQLFDRNTRSVRLTEAGSALLDAARRAVAAADEAADVARRIAAGDLRRPLRVDVSSAGLETGARILRRLRLERPELAVEEVEYGVARALPLVRDGTVDVVLGLADRLPTGIASRVIRHEPVLVGCADDHPLAALDAVPVARLADEKLLLPSDEAAGDWVRYVEGFCRAAGFVPRRWPGVTHGSVGAAEVVRGGGCVVPSTAWIDPPAGVAFRPLVDPTPVFPWSAMWRDEPDPPDELAAFLACAGAVARERGWPA
jgi:DNA-binding transcriptional LysR family regulator